MSPVIFRPIARDELTEAIAWYETQRSGLGHAFKAAIEKAVEEISRNPHHFGRLPGRGEIRRAQLRRFPYIVVFVVELNTVVILAVFHTNRDPRRLRGRS